MKRNKILSLKLKRSSSGVSSEESLSCSIKSNETQKRPSEVEENPINDKKIKLTDSNSNDFQIDDPTDQTTSDLFDGTLDCANLTQILLKNSLKATKSSNIIETESLPHNPIQKPAPVDPKPGCSKADEKASNEDSWGFENELSQFFKSTQVLREIDTIIGSNTNTPESSKTFQKPQTPSPRNKVPEIIKPLLEKSGLSPLIDKSTVFHTEEATTQYLKEVDDLFEKIEHSICIMGTEEEKIEASKSQTVSDEILNIVFSDVEAKQAKAAAEFSENTILNNLELSFGTSFQKALEVNANKSVRMTQNRLSLSFLESKTDFKCLGSFYGLPERVKDLIFQYKGIDKLYDWQDECLKLPAIESRKNLIYALPTSGGKTLVAEILVLREIMCRKKNALFILPFVAIVQEKVWALSPFAVALDFLVEEYASSKGNYPPKKRRRKNCVYIATIEKALNLINSLIETGRLQELGLIVVDELHLIGEEGRGPTLEALLSKIMFLKANVQIVGMSATIGNLNDICTFLEADVYTKNFRPVELTEYVKCGNELARVDWNHADESELLTDVKKVDYKYTEAINRIDPDHLAGLVMEVIPDNSCLIFCASKKNCENVATLLCKIFNPNLREHKKKEKQHLLNALEEETGEICKVLKVSVQFGVAYHHSGLTNEERRLIEDAFRAGIICVICCTSTLAAGVNLPAKRVILRSPYVARDFITLSQYKQMTGRAGRAGLGECGESILITNNKDLAKVKKLLLSPMSQALSTMHFHDGKGLRHFMLSCISLGIANSRVELQAVASKTLMAVQQKYLDINIKKLTDRVIKNLFKLGALQEGAVGKKKTTLNLDSTVQMDTSTAADDSQVKSTQDVNPKKTIVVNNNTKLVVSALGNAAIKGGLELSRAHTLYEDLHKAQSSLVLLDCLHLLYLVTPYDIAEQITPNTQIYHTKLLNLDKKQMHTAKILGFNEPIIMRMMTGLSIQNIPERVMNRFYLALMLYDLWNEIPVYQVSESYQINRGIVQNLMTHSATFASCVMYFCDELSEFWAFTHLLKGMSQRLSHCCVKELVPLMDLPAVKQNRAKQLYNAGYKNLQSIARANANELVEKIEFLPRRVANQLIAASKMILLERVENLREEAEDVLEGVDSSFK